MRVRVIAATLLCTSVANAAQFDPQAARAALEKVHVKHCGYGGPGEVHVTFAPTGFVSEVEVYEGKYTDNAIRCIERLFRAPELLAFDGEPQTVKWKIALPLEQPVVAPPIFVAPVYNFVPPKKWHPGDPPPPGYRVEEEARTGLAFGGLVLTLTGVVLVASAVSKSSSEDIDMLSPSLGIVGGLIAVGGAIMMLAGLSTSKTRLVRKSANP